MGPPCPLNRHSGLKFQWTPWWAFEFSGLKMDSTPADSTAESMAESAAESAGVKFAADFYKSSRRTCLGLSESGGLKSAWNQADLWNWVRQNWTVKVHQTKLEQSRTHVESVWVHGELGGSTSAQCHPGGVLGGVHGRVQFGPIGAKWVRSDPGGAEADSSPPVRAPLIQYNTGLRGWVGIKN